MKKIIFLTLTILIVSFLITPVANAKVSIPEKVRIGLYFNDVKGGYNNTVGSISLSSSKGIGIYSDASKNSLLWEHNGAENITVTKMSSSNDRLVVKQNNNIILEGIQLLYIVPKSTTISLNGKHYRGAIEIKILNGKDMTVINHVDLEEYLYGVVPREMSPSSPMEALKAQAVAARTYVLNNIRKYEHLGFNLCATTTSQAYGGYSVERATTNAAVDATRGEIVTYNGNPAATYYFSSCGGMTEDVANVWGSSVPYLVSVPVEYESEDSYNYKWSVEFTPNEIENIMKSMGSDIGQFISINITKRSETGRVTELQVRGTKGIEIITNSRTRTCFSLYSQLFDIETGEGMYMVSAGDNIFAGTTVNKRVVSAHGSAIFTKYAANLSVIGANGQTKLESANPTSIIFTGTGWGHSVGMSQEGAKGMARAGYTYDEILTHFYQGTKVE